MRFLILCGVSFVSLACASKGGDPSPKGGGTGGTPAPDSGSTGGGLGTGGLTGTGGAPDSGETDSGGGAGGGPVQPIQQCLSDEDCSLHSNCCNCVAIPSGGTPPACSETCETDKCSEMGHAGPARCSAGQCVAGFDCDTSKVTCINVLPPAACEAGTVRSVVDGCWGPCVPATQCEAVMDCAQCDPSLHVCVVNSVWLQSYHCVDPGTCETDRSCECLGDAVCGGFQCGDTAADGIGCFCVVC